MSKSKIGFKLVSLFVSTLMVASFATGCSNNSGNSAASGSSSSGTPSGTITYNFWGNTDEAKNIQTIVDNYQKTNPNVKVNIVYSDWTNYWTKLQTQFASGSAPDVFAMSTTMYLKQYASKGWLANMSELAERDGLDMSKYYQAAIDLNSYNGVLYSMPQDINTIIMAYNKDLFDKANLKVPGDDVTWDEILEDAKLLTIDENGKNSTEPGFDKDHIKQWGISNFGSESDAAVDPMCNSNGVGMISDDGKTAQLTDPAVVDSIKYLYDLIWTYHVAPDYNTVPAGTDIFVTGQSAIARLPSYLLYGYKSTTGLNYEVSQMPAGKSGKHYNAVQSKGISIYSKSKNIDAAWDFVKYIGSEECYTNVVKAGSGLSPIESVNKDVFLNLDFGPKTTKQVYLDALNNPCPIPNSLMNGEAYSEMGTELAEIMANHVSVDEGMKKMNDTVQEILDKVEE